MSDRGHKNYGDITIGLKRPYNCGNCHSACNSLKNHSQSRDVWRRRVYINSTQIFKELSKTSLLQLIMQYDYICNHNISRKIANINVKKLGSLYVVLTTSTANIKPQICIINSHSL